MDEKAQLLTRDRSASCRAATTNPIAGNTVMLPYFIVPINPNDNQSSPFNLGRASNAYG